MPRATAKQQVYKSGFYCIICVLICTFTGATRGDNQDEKHKADNDFYPKRNSIFGAFL